MLTPRIPIRQNGERRIELPFSKPNSSEMMKKLSDTEDAIVQRMRKLFLETRERERAGMDDLMHALKALENALEHGNRAG